MKKFKVKSYGIAKDIVGGREIVVESSANTAGELRTQLISNYPQLSGLRSIVIAVNLNYAEDNQAISETDEIVLIPPVSGG